MIKRQKEIQESHMEQMGSMNEEEKERLIKDFENDKLHLTDVSERSVPIYIFLSFSRGLENKLVHLFSRFSLFPFSHPCCAMRRLLWWSTSVSRRSCRPS